MWAAWPQARLGHRRDVSGFWVARRERKGRLWSREHPVGRALPAWTRDDTVAKCMQVLFFPDRIFSSFSILF